MSENPTQEEHDTVPVPPIEDIVSQGAYATQFTYGCPGDFSVAVENARLEQEAMVGYPLMVRSLRQTHSRDIQGRDVYEVFATFAPSHVAPHAQGAGASDKKD